MLRRIHHLVKRSHQTLASSPFNHPSTSLGNKFSYGHYNPELKLLASLIDPPSESEAPSPFILAERTESEYLELFREQIAIEENCFTKITNVARKSDLVSMEELIKKWEWKEHIEENLARRIYDRDMSEELFAYFKKIDEEKCAEQLITFLQAILCRGQRSVPFSEFETILPRIVLNLSTDPFRRALDADHKKSLEYVFSEYIRYYTDEQISRKYTMREWWYKCTSRLQLPPSCYPIFEMIFKVPMKEISQLLISFFIEQCEFPLYVTRKNKKEKLKRKWVPAFSIKDIPIYEMNPHEKVGRKTYLCKMLEVHPHISEMYCQQHQFENLYFPSHLLPMKVPPRPWLDRGKYGPNFMFKQNLIRKLDEHPDMDVNKEILDKRIHTKDQARPVFDALNLLGATPWKINKEMLGHLMKVLEMTHDSSKAGFLKRLDIPRHQKTIDIEHFGTFKRRFKKKQIEEEGKKDDEIVEKEIQDAYDKYYENKLKSRNEHNSLWCWLTYRLILANHYAGQVIYFPHNVDFRGRTYPISPQINHMGDDVNRGLLKFAKGKPLGESGFRWLKLHCINITGKMKRSPLHDRLKYAEQNMNQIIRSAERPFEGGDWWWKESEEPWQTLATCIEIRNAIESGDPHSYCSNLPIHQDGSCNGLQHYAALGRDLKGAREVNLLPEDRPQDIYTTVVESVERMRVEDEQNKDSKFHEVAVELRKFIKGPLERKIIKQTVMTTVYGVTQYGARGQIKRQLIAIDIPNKKAAEFSTYLAGRTFDGLTDAFQNSMELMDWFKSCAGQVLKLQRPLEWVTPLGFPVIQPYVKIEKVDKNLSFLPVPHKQKNAFPPNFIHSLDSTHMMLTALHAQRQGITFAAVHDCFWTHACDVDEMNRICRDQFIALHEEPIIQNLSESFVSTYLPNELRRRMKENVVQEMEQTFRPVLKSGELDINEVRKSIYFFS